MKLQELILYKPFTALGINFKENINTKRDTRVKLNYSERLRWIEVTVADKVGYVPIEAVAFMVELDAETFKPVVTTSGVDRKIKAQVSTPQNIPERE